MIFMREVMKGGETKRMRSKRVDMAVGLAAFVLVLILGAGFAVAVDPNGATVSPGTPERAGSDNAGEDEAYAGNVTELTISGNSITQSWQGYFGNVSGVIQLADSGDNVLYNWTLLSPSGEVYASTNQTVTWGNIQCFNFTANGSRAGTGGETAGGVSLGGMNLTQLEEDFGIGSADVDGVNETFSDANSHAAFYTASNEFTSGECLSTDIYQSGGPTDGQFEEVLLYEPETASVVFAALLEQDVSGFDSATHDFELLVLEDGHGIDVSSTTYYFFVELE
jgi:hypothetical protein